MKRRLYSPVSSFIAPSAPEIKVGTPGELVRSNDGKFGFSADKSNWGGRMILNDEYEKHRLAIKHVRSPLCDQMKPPHAFIDNCKAGKTDFKGTFKKRRPMSTILTRKMKNIDQLLH